MKIKIIAAGKNMPGWVQSGFTEYSKRWRAHLHVDLIEIPLAKRARQKKKQHCAPHTYQTSTNHYPGKATAYPSNAGAPEQPHKPTHGSANISHAKAEEGKAMLKHIGKGDMVITLDVTGKQWDTFELAQQLQHWREAARDVCLLIGGPDGLGRECLERANQHWSLSKLTLPHPLVRILLAEQLYRALTICQGHPYHRSG